MKTLILSRESIMQYSGKNEEYFELTYIDHGNSEILTKELSNKLSLLWFESDQNHIDIDAKSYVFGKNQIICLTEFHNVETKSIGKLRLIRFNRPFYCILDHDSEVGCKGILYYGASNLPILNPSVKDIQILSTVWDMMSLEMESRDNLQLEMLQMMLRRLLILCTRIYRISETTYSFSPEQSDLVRNFNFQVEQYFREKHTVAEYASLLHKSPKTISNLFKKSGNKTPLHFIQKRILLEARRLLRYSDKGIAEIGIELGFNDVQAFSRFFSKQEAISPSAFRNSAE
ncbi:MAG: AraC family transcriptional activator of pobA [Limisphaerales bacterium]|jgi:AraC family transcriptional activator of pobA